jgi:hypothetical protein
VPGRSQSKAERFEFAHVAEWRPDITSKANRKIKMSIAPMSPIRFSPSFEKPEDDELATSEGLRQTLKGISEKTQKDYGHGVRSVHAKSHALLEGTLTIWRDLPAVLSQGLFGSPGDHPVIMRISTIPGDILDDHVSLPRGLAIKVFDVEGERLPGSESDTTQDFLMVNGPAFGANKASAFLSTLKTLAKTTDRVEGLKIAWSAALRGIEAGLEALGTKSPLLVALGGHPLSNPAGEVYFSQTPFLYGDYVAKFSLVPVSPNLTAVSGVKLNLLGRDGLREELGKLFSAGTSMWEFRVQLLTDKEKMPVEDASVAWPEDVSPFITVATISVHPQPVWSLSRSKVGDDTLAFNPWHGIMAHRPLGSINRVRRASYEISTELRSQFNGCPIHEPRNVPKLPA